MKLKIGTTRMTILIGNYAIKFPIINRDIKHFVKGWLGNIDESYKWKELKNDKLCPIYFSLFGLFNIMPKIKSPLIEFNKDDIINYFKDVDVYIDICSGWKNFGLLNGKLVISDYASNRESGEFCSDCDINCIKKNK